jgi:hypothetical protein
MAALSTPTHAEHAAVVRVLEALNGELLAQHGVVFAGGTRLTLAFGEYRVSRDADFLAADRQGYASLRSEVRQAGGIRRLFVPGHDLELPAEARIDQYGIRFPAIVGGSRIKVEFVAEGRMALMPGEVGPIASVPWAQLVDCYAEKLLANSDRWADDAFLSRDLIDLAALRVHVGPVPELAWTKARDAYGTAVANDLQKAAHAFEAHSDYRRTCFARLEVRQEDQLLLAINDLLVESQMR